MIGAERNVTFPPRDHAGLGNDPVRAVLPRSNAESAGVARDLPTLSGEGHGHLLDRIDMHVEVPAVAFKELRGKREATPQHRFVNAWKRREMFRGSADFEFADSSFAASPALRAG